MFDKHALSLWLKKIGISYKVKKPRLLGLGSVCCGLCILLMQGMLR